MEVGGCEHTMQCEWFRTRATYEVDQFRLICLLCLITTYCSGASFSYWAAARTVFDSGVQGLQIDRSMCHMYQKSMCHEYSLAEWMGPVDLSSVGYCKRIALPLRNGGLRPLFRIALPPFVFSVS